MLTVPLQRMKITTVFGLITVLAKETIAHSSHLLYAPPLCALMSLVSLWHMSLQCTMREQTVTF